MIGRGRIARIFPLRGLPCPMSVRSQGRPDEGPQVAADRAQQRPGSYVSRLPLCVGKAALVLFCAGSDSALRAQSPTELVQGVQGLTPAAYYELTLQAQQSTQQRDYAAAAAAYARLVEAYPWDSNTWFWLGYARFQEQEYGRAGEAFEQSHELGVEAYARNLPSFAARAYAHSGQDDQALRWLELALHDYKLELPQRLLRDSAFDGLRQHPRFQALAPPSISDATPRVQGWDTDLDYMLEQVQILNPVYSERPLPDTLITSAAELRKRIPTLTDAQVAIEMQRLLVMLGQSHNTFYFPYSPPEENARASFKWLPLEFYLFPEGLYVTAASSPHEDLIGARVLRFDGTPAVTALEATAQMNDRENEVEVAQATGFLRMPQVLHALGITQSADRAILTVRDPKGRERTVEMPAVRYEELGTFSTGPEHPDSSLPASLRRSDESFWFEAMPAEGAIYVQFNAVLNSREESLSQFGRRLRNYLSEHPEFTSLIVDMRRNNGGNTYLYTELLRTLIAFDAEDGNQLFILIGRRTYSAAQNFIADLDRLTGAVFAGEPSGGRPNTVGGDLAIVDLPYSNLRLGLASASWIQSWPRDRRLWIAPDLPVAITAEDYFKGRDPVLEAVLDWPPD